MKFTVSRANIVNIFADAIVLPANEKLKEGPGTSRAIFEAAGRSELTKACSEIGHCDTGLAVATPAFGLDAKYIIHAVVPKWRGGNHDEYGYLSSAYLASMKLADIMECKSIAFPLLASGNNGFNLEHAFRIAQESIKKFDGKHLKYVTLVVYRENVERFVRSQGYEVTVIEETKPVHKLQLQDATKKIIGNGLKVAGDWLKDENNRNELIETGLDIASAYLPPAGKVVIETIRKIRNS